MAMTKKTATKKAATKKAATKKTATRKKKPQAKPTELPTVDFHYLKGNDFRSVHVDGAIGGITSKGNLHIALYAERGVIPRKTTHVLSQGGRLGDEIVEKREGRDGLIRQIEVDIFMSEATARDIRVWLDQKLEEFQGLRNMMEQQKGDHNE